MTPAAIQEQIVELARDGYKDSEIVKLTGATYGVVQRYRRQAGISRNHAKKLEKELSERDQKIIEKVMTGVEESEIAIEFGLSRQRIHQLEKQWKREKLLPRDHTFLEEREVFLKPFREAMSDPRLHCIVCKEPLTGEHKKITKMFTCPSCTKILRALRRVKYYLQVQDDLKARPRIQYGSKAKYFIKKYKITPEMLKGV